MEFKGRPANTPQGGLARLWRNIIKDNKLEPSLGYLVTRYVTKTGETSRAMKRKTRSSIEADITANEMTWRKIIHLIFEYLGAKRLDVSMKVTFANGKDSTHTVGLLSSNPVAEKTKDAKDVHTE